jgi:hypothetical protein
MSAGDLTQGRRLEDVAFGDLPADLEPGTYWRYLDETGEPMECSAEQRARGNLTGGVWGFCAPNGAGIGTLMLHTVREHEDGTATIAPGDGSSNSVLISSGERSWHGFLERGVWREV